MTKTTDFTNFATKYPHYFPGQYLLEDDFELQHKYLSDRQRYYNQSLHVSGIIEGLEVEKITDKAVQIGSGSAIDSQGNLIVFKEKEGKQFSDFNKINEGELYIEYHEEYDTTSRQQNDYTRRQEAPTFGFEATTPDNGVKLATLTISESGEIINVDLSIREYSGLSLPNSNGEALTLRSGGSANPNVAVLTGSLQIDENLTVAGTGTSSFAGNLDVSGTISGNIDTASITSGQLAVDRIPKLSADKITSGTIAGNLTVNGAMTPSVGNSYTNGIMFPENAFGSSSGDAAWIRYYRRGGNGIATTLEIGISDDDNDHIALMPVKGGVGIGINDPGSYKLYVEGNQYLSGDLTVSGAGTSSFAGKLEVTGDVGLGTSNQDGYKLTVQGNQYLDGNLDVNGTISGNINAASIISGELALARIPNLSADKITSGTIAGNLTVSGNLRISGQTGISMEHPSDGDHRGDGTQNPTGLVCRIESNPDNGDPIFQVRSQGQGVRFFVEHNGWTGSRHNSAWFGGSTYNYFKGSVGIGIQDPGAKLEVAGGTTKLEQEDWKTPTFENNWVVTDEKERSAGYFKDSLGIVHLKGIVKWGGLPDEVEFWMTIFTLPAGYKPSEREIQAVITNNTIGRVDIIEDGRVTVVDYKYAAWVTLYGITFRAA